MKTKQNIVLCGFMGCGKSTVAAALSQTTGFPLLDTDHWIEQQTASTIPALFQQHGEAYFRAWEYQAAQTAATLDRHIISTGGGMLTNADVVALLRQNGMLFFLDVPFEECLRRISTTDRPLLQSNDRESFYQLYQSRYAMYQNACSHHIVFQNQTVDQVCTQILDLYGPVY